MRKTVTFDDDTLDTARGLEEREDLRAALVELSGKDVPESESGRIALLTAIGAEIVEKRAMERGYKALAELLDADPTPTAMQPELGRGLPGESDERFSELFKALNP